LIPAFVVPIVVWDPAEIEPPARDGLALLRDIESGMQRAVGLRARTRRAWREATAARRSGLIRFFADRGLRPFFLTGRFDADALSQYFFEVAA
jgi:hypothetical protein